VPVFRYGCRKKVPLENLENDLLASLPSLEVIRDDELQIRQTTVNLSTGASYRWALALNTDKIQTFKLETSSEAGVQIFADHMGTFLFVSLSQG
jgi:hypothetical protein